MLKGANIERMSGGQMEKKKKKYTSNQITLFFYSLNSLLDCCSFGEANLKTFARGGGETSQ